MIEFLKHIHRWSEWKFLLSLVGILGMILGVLVVGGFGNLCVGILSLAAAGFCFYFLASNMNQLINIFTFMLWGSSFSALGSLSLYCYKKNLHDPLLFFQQEIGYVAIPGWIAKNQELLTVVLFVCTITLAFAIKEVMGTMPYIILGVLFSAIIGSVVLFFTHSILVSWLIFLIILLLLYDFLRHLIRNGPLVGKHTILTIISIFPGGLQYINGHTGKTYKEEEWQKLSVEEKKKEIRKRIAAFAGDLSCGYYMIETHEAMYHLIEKNLAEDKKISYNKKFPTIFPGKSKGEFEALYGKKVGVQIWGHRKDYLWYFEITEKKSHLLGH